MRALILDVLDARASLAGARALRRAGWAVGVGARHRDGLAARSRATCAWHPVPSPRDGADAFVAAVNRAVEEGQYEIVFPSSDLELLALSAAREQLAAVVPYAPHERVLRALDKLELARACARVGLNAPRTAPASEEAVAELGREGRVIIKERMHGALAVGRSQATSGAGSAAAAASAGPAASGGPPPDEIDAALVQAPAALEIVRDARRLGLQAVVQEEVSGALMALTVVADRHSRAVVRVQQRAERTWPPDVGLSVRARSEPIDERLAAGVEDLLGELGWFGLAELQFLAPADGPPHLIDFNGRFYGSLALATAAGVNLPAIWAALATDREPELAGDGRASQRYQWLEGDLRTARANGSGASDVFGCLLYAAGARHSVWSASDPAPAIGHYRRLLASRLR